MSVVECDHVIFDLKCLPYILFLPVVVIYLELFQTCGLQDINAFVCGILQYNKKFCGFGVVQNEYWNSICN